MYFGNLLPVRRAKEQCAQNQHVERTLQKTFYPTWVDKLLSISVRK